MARQTQSTELDAIVQRLAEHGFDGMAQAIETLMNEAMKLQRSDALGARPYQRTGARRGEWRPACDACSPIFVRPPHQGR